MNETNLLPLPLLLSIFVNWIVFQSWLQVRRAPESFPKKNPWGLLVRDVYMPDVVPVTQPSVSQH